MSILRVGVDTQTRAAIGETNAYVVGESQSLLIDPGAQNATLDEVVSNRSIDHIAVTHTHPDHVGSVQAYAAETDATVWARFGRTDRFESTTGVTPDRAFREGTIIPAGTPLSVLELPGHAPDHVGFITATGTDSIAIVGDLVTATGSVFVGSRDGDMRAYYTALRRVIAREFDLLYPGHGDPITSPRNRVTALLAHRLARERKIEAVVEGGARTIDEIVTAAYDKDLDGVEGLAAETVRAHLEKLDRERRLDWDGSIATP